MCQGRRVIIDSLGAVVTSEVNGEHKFEFTLPATHKYTSTLTNEQFVEVEGERYRIRRITDAQYGRKVHTTVFAEAQFYDLATAGQIDAPGVPAGGGGRRDDYCVGWHRVDCGRGEHSELCARIR